MMQITASERDALYKIIASRRDVRSDFLPHPIPPDVLKRILTAAHQAPSVGFMQPWDFIVINKMDTRRKIKDAFNKANTESADQFSDQKKSEYLKLKLEGITEAPIGICVTCDRSRNGPVVLGRTIKPEMDLYSSVCAIQNLWLAARAENLGLGWVSIIHDSALKEILDIPPQIEIIGYLCLGYVSQFKEKPELETKGWLPRADINDVIHLDKWTDKQ